MEFSEGDRASAIARLRAACSTAHGAPLISVSDDARAASRLLETWLAKNPQRRLLLGRKAEWFQVEEAAVQTLNGEAAPARILDRLAEIHAGDPTRTAGVDALFRAAWGDESIAPSSVANRVRVAVSQLRKRGLAAVIQLADGGYRLDPNWLIVRGRR